MVEKLTLRQKNRLHAMRLVQSTAVAMFEDRGFDAVTIESVAELCGVSPSTVYRHFGTKENIVLWDERDAVIDAQLGRRLTEQAPVQAFRDSVMEALADREDRRLFLRRLKLIYAEPSILAAAAKQDYADRRELAAALASVAGRRRANPTDEFIAAACLAALDVALDNWQRHNGRQGLGRLIDQAFSPALKLES